ncbi:MAG: hypothetical protein U5J62_08000 [Desulfurivibrio sp.]|nr:hypothetical protein [Desulfurivibrio sp.]
MQSPFAAGAAALRLAGRSLGHWEEVERLLASLQVDIGHTSAPVRLDTAANGGAGLVANGPRFSGGGGVSFWWLYPAALLAVLLLTAQLRRYALSRRLLDIPNRRSSHTVPTPARRRGGGGAGGVGRIIVVGVAWDIAKHHIWGPAWWRGPRHPGRLAG